MTTTKQLKTQVSQLETDLATLRQDHASVQAALSEAETDLSALWDSYRQKDGTIDAVVNAKSKINTLQGILTKLDTSISETEAELRDATAALERHEAESAIPTAQETLNAAQSAYRDHQRQLLQTVRTALGELEGKAVDLQNAANTVSRLRKMTGQKAHVSIRTDPESAFSEYQYPDLGGELRLLQAIQAFMSAPGYRKTEAERRDRATRSRERAELDRKKTEAFQQAKERATHGDVTAMPEYYAKYGGDEGQSKPAPLRSHVPTPTTELMDLIERSRA